MENQIDHEIDQIDKLDIQAQNKTLLRQATLLKQQIQQLKQVQNNLQKQLSVYKKVVFEGGDTHQVLEMQHAKIVELETQMQILQEKSQSKSQGKSYSSQETQYAIKCREYERRMQQSEKEHQRQIGALKQKIVKFSAMQIVESGKISRNGKLPTLNQSVLNTRKYY